MALTDSEISYWKADESSGNAADSIASNTLTNNGTAGYVAALINNGFDLGSANVSKYFNNATNFGIAGTGDMSVSFWLKLTTDILASEWIFFAFRSTLTADRYLQLGYQYNLGTRRLNLNAANAFGTSNLTMGTSDWYFFVITRASGSVNVYLNGNSTPVITVAQSTATAGQNYLAFGNDGGSFGYVSGVFDELSIWSRAITTTEISTLYNSGAGLQYPFAAGPSNLKSLNTNVKANIKSYNTNVLANIKSINTNT